MTLLLLLVRIVRSSGLPKAVPTQTRQPWVQRGYELFVFRVVFVSLEVGVYMCVYIFVGCLLDLYFFPSCRREQPCVKYLGILQYLDNMRHLRINSKKQHSQA